MYKDINIRNHANTLISNQQNLIHSWSSPTFDRTESYTKRLREIVRYAIELESYKEIFRMNKNKDKDIQSFLSNAYSYKEILKELPIIYKKEYRKISEEAISVRRSQFSNYFETSGTTDKPVPAPKER